MVLFYLQCYFTTSLDSGKAVTHEQKCRWGNMTSINQIRQELDLRYDTIVTWRKNFFLVPRGNAGKNFLSEATRIINLYNNDTLNSIALKSFSVFLPMMLPKPSHNSKAKDHSKYLQKRLQFWEKGDL